MADTITPDPTVLAAVNGDREAFGRIWTQQRADVFRRVLANVHDHHLTEDITSETFTRALRSIGTLKTDGRPIQGWLVTISQNVTRNHYRDKRRHPTWDLPSPDRSASDNPEKQVTDRDLALRVLRFVSWLPNRQREVMVLRFIDGFTYQEVADVLGCSVQAVYQSQYAAQREIRRLMGLQRSS